MSGPARTCTTTTLASLLFALAAAATAGAEPVTAIRSNGSSAARVDIVILGDGYMSGELGTYATQVESFVQGLFAQQPYQEYQKYFNVWRVDVASVESGADHPEVGSFKNTAFDSTYNCSGIQRLICVSTAKVNTMLTNSNVAANAKDIILVLVNDGEYGGSGGAIAVASTHSAAVELILHEVGHSFAQLADEYTDSPPPCSLTEPPAANATIETVRASIKWTSWIDAGTPIPTTGTTAGVPGLYQGAMYCTSGKYRPTFNSKMRSLGLPFEQINTEQHIRRVYNFVSPIDASMPAATTLDYAPGQATFTVTPQLPMTHNLDIVWRVNGVQVASGVSTYVTGGLSTGTHQVTATVRDLTTMVRNDPSSLLTATRTWTVNVTAFTDHPAAAGATTIKAAHVTELRARVNSVRTARGLAAATFTDPVLSAGMSVQAGHIIELRSALAAVYVALQATQPAYTDPVLSAGMAIKAAHFNELRGAVVAVQ